MATGTHGSDWASIKWALERRPPKYPFVASHAMRFDAPLWPEASGDAGEATLDDVPSFVRSSVRTGNDLLGLTYALEPATTVKWERMDHGAQIGVVWDVRLTGPA